MGLLAARRLTLLRRGRLLTTRPLLASAGSPTGAIIAAATGELTEEDVDVVYRFGALLGHVHHAWRETAANRAPSPGRGEQASRDTRGG